MAKVMKPSSLSGILRRAAGEYKAKSSIFEIPAALFDSIFEIEAESPGLAVMSGRASIPVGPAAGPHTQIAPNILAAYLAGARVFELKTVQIKDRLDIDAGGLQQLLAQRAAQAAADRAGRKVVAALFHQPAHQREAVGVQAARGQADQQVSRPGLRRVQHVLAVDQADRKAGDVVLVLAVKAGHLGHLAAHQRTAGRHAAVGHAPDDLGRALGVVREPVVESVEHRDLEGTVEVEHVLQTRPRGRHRRLLERGALLELEGLEEHLRDVPARVTRARRRLQGHEQHTVRAVQRGPPCRQDRREQDLAGAVLLRRTHLDRRRGHDLADRDEVSLDGEPLEGTQDEVDGVLHHGTAGYSCPGPRRAPGG